MSIYDPGLEMAAQILEMRLDYAKKNTSCPSRDRQVAIIEIECAIKHVRNHITNKELQEGSALVMVAEAFMK